jgi:hypothetical protein
VIVSSIKININSIIVCYFKYFFLNETRNIKTFAAIILIRIKDKAVVGKKKISFYSVTGSTVIVLAE